MIGNTYDVEAMLGDATYQWKASLLVGQNGKHMRILKIHKNLHTSNLTGCPHILRQVHKIIIVDIVQHNRVPEICNFNQFQPVLLMVLRLLCRLALLILARSPLSHLIVSSHVYRSLVVFSLLARTETQGRTFVRTFPSNGWLTAAAILLQNP